MTVPEQRTAEDSERQWQTHRIPIVGFTPEQRSRAVQIWRRRYENTGWQFVMYEDSGLVGSRLIMRKPKATTFRAALVETLTIIKGERWASVSLLLAALIAVPNWPGGALPLAIILLAVWTKASRFVPLAGRSMLQINVALLCGLTALGLGYGLVAAEGRRKEAEDRDAQVSQQMLVQTVETNRKVAASLQATLEVTGLVPTVYARVVPAEPPIPGVVVIVTNQWLGLPYFTRLQGVQTIQAVLTNSVRGSDGANGYSFRVVDEFGNEWGGVSAFSRAWTSNNTH